MPIERVTFFVKEGRVTFQTPAKQYIEDLILIIESIGNYDSLQEFTLKPYKVNNLLLDISDKFYQFTQEQKDRDNVIGAFEKLISIARNVTIKGKEAISQFIKKISNDSQHFQNIKTLRADMSDCIALEGLQLHCLPCLKQLNLSLELFCKTSDQQKVFSAVQQFPENQLEEVTITSKKYLEYDREVFMIQLLEQVSNHQSLRVLDIEVQGNYWDQHFQVVCQNLSNLKHFCASFCSFNYDWFQHLKKLRVLNVKTFTGKVTIDHLPYLERLEELKLKKFKKKSYSMNEGYELLFKALESSQRLKSLEITDWEPEQWAQCIIKSTSLKRVQCVLDSRAFVQFILNVNKNSKIEDLFVKLKSNREDSIGDHEENVSLSSQPMMSLKRLHIRSNLKRNLKQLAEVDFLYFSDFKNLRKLELKDVYFYSETVVKNFFMFLLSDEKSKLEELKLVLVVFESDPYKYFVSLFEEKGCQLKKLDYHTHSQSENQHIDLINSVAKNKSLNTFKNHSLNDYQRLALLQLQKLAKHPNLKHLKFQVQEADDIDSFREQLRQVHQELAQKWTHLAKLTFSFDIKDGRSQPIEIKQRVGELKKEVVTDLRSRMPHAESIKIITKREFRGQFDSF